MLKLNLGCGLRTPDGWLNADYWIGARLRKTPVLGFLTKPFFKADWNDSVVLQDLTAKWQWSDNTVDVVYSSHTIEHLWREDGEHFMAEAFRVLKPGGVLRVIVPDLNRFVERYLQGEFKSTEFVKKLSVIPFSRNDSWYARMFSSYFRFPHKCMYDLDDMKALIENAGFEITSTSAENSAIEDLENIERPDRLVNAIVVEAIKPQ